MTASRGRLAALAFVSDLGSQVLLTGATLVATPIILGLTSESLYGFWITTYSILGYLGLVDLGIGMSVTRHVATLPDDESGWSRLNGVATQGFALFAAASVVFAVLGLAAAPYIATWFKIPVAEHDEIVWAYRVAVIGGAVALPLATFTGVLSGLQRMAVSNLIRTAGTLGGLAASIFMLDAGVGLVSLPLGTLGGLTVSSIASYIAIRRVRPSFRLESSGHRMSDLRSLVSYGGFFQLGRIGNTIATAADAVVIASVLGAALVTPYSLTSKLAVLFSVGLASKLPVALLPAAAQMFARGEVETLRLLFIRLTYYSTRLAAVAATVLILGNRDFVTLWVGPEQFGGTMLTLVFGIWILQDTVYRGTTALVYASDDMRKWAFASVLEGALNVLLSVFLARRFGLVGVALGTTIAKCLTTGIYVPRLICKRLQLPVATLVRQGIISPFLTSAIGIGLTAGVATLLPDASWFGLIVLGTSATAINVALFEGRAISTAKGPWRTRLLLAYPHWPR